MRLIGYRRTKLQARDLKALLEVLTPIFGHNDFWHDLEGDSGDKWESFDFNSADAKLRHDGTIGFFKRDIVGIGMDNQAFRNAKLIYQHSVIEVESMTSQKSQTGCSLEPEQWFCICKELTARLELELTIVIGTKERFAGYDTPLSIGIGLPKIFWIMCFGEGFSRLIAPPSGNSTFFKRENVGTRLALMSAPSYELYLAAPGQALKSQRQEIGEDLFHSYPPQGEQKGGAEASWILSPKNIVRFALFLARQHMTNWRKYQARVVPSYYRERVRK